MAYTKINNVLSTAMSKVNNVAVADISKVDNVAVPVSDFGWSTGGNLYAARQAMGAAGTQTAALSVAGAGGGVYVADCGEYNGTAWTQSGVGSLGAIKGSIACGGSQTAGIMAGGNNASSEFDTSELYDGSSWSSSSVINQDTSALNGCGAGTSNTSFTMAGGDGYPGGAKLDAVENFNGTAWSDLASMVNAANYMMTFGAADDCFCIGGYGSGGAPVQQYNGTSWSVSSETLISDQRQQAGCFGTTSSGLIVGGAGVQSGGGSWGDLATVEQWNGTAWSAEDDYPIGAADNCQGTGFRASGTGGGLMWAGAPSSGESNYTGEYG
jgi:hypothetical protein